MAIFNSSVSLPEGLLGSIRKIIHKKWEIRSVHVTHVAGHRLAEMYNVPALVVEELIEAPQYLH